MSFPFPLLWNELEKKHKHKDIKDLVLNVTDKDSMKNNCQKKRIKSKSNQGQEHLFKRAYEIKETYRADKEKMPLKEENKKFLRSLASSFNELGGMTPANISEENDNESNSIIEKILKEITDIDKA